MIRVRERWIRAQLAQVLLSAGGRAPRRAIARAGQMIGLLEIGAWLSSQSVSKPEVLGSRDAVFSAALSRLRNAQEPAYLEFGVADGDSMRWWSENLTVAQAHLIGFDSFEGLPEDWAGTGSPKGAFDLGGNLPTVPNNVALVKGWFDDTIPEWKKQNDGPVSYCNVDCDLYSSTVTIFRELEDRFIPGTVIHFDDYFGYADWRNGEHKAFLEMLDRTGFSYDAKALGIMQFVVQLKK